MATPQQPNTMTIAITGHREIADPGGVAKAVRRVLTKLAAQGPVELISPLAEGADRIAAREVLRLPGGVLRVVLPLRKDDYEQDFETRKSRAEFRQLLGSAAEVTVMPILLKRPAAYDAVGRVLARACDILLAIWDGLPARGVGGTAEVVARARHLGKALIIIDSRHPEKVRSEGLGGLEGDVTP